MKKLLVACALLAIAAPTYAQKSKIRSAAMYLEEKDYTKAMSSIEEAIAHNDTKDNPDAWFTKGAILLQMISENKINQQEGIDKAYESFMKVTELKPNYDPDKLAAILPNIGSMYYNAGVQSYNGKKYETAISEFDKTLKVFAPGGKSRYPSIKSIDTIIADAKKYQAFAAVYGQKYDKAVELLNVVKEDKIARNEDVYNLLIQSYESLGQDAGLLKAIDEARAAYPSNKNFVNSELNYYIKNKKQDVLVKKLEDAVTKDPSNADLLFTLGMTYDNMANPRDAKGNDLPKPENSKALLGKAAETYDKVLAANPNHIGALYNKGTLMFNRGVEFNKVMNSVSGTSAADQKKYDLAKDSRNKEFDAALPIYESIVTKAGANLATLTSEDKMSYQQSLNALYQIYNVKGQADKAKEMKSKLDSFR